MKLKVDENGHVVVKDGMPVYVHDDGKEIPFDAPGAMNKIAQVQSEAKGHREAKEVAETKLKAFEGIEDPEAARKAIDTVSNLDSGKLLTAGKVDEIKAAARKAADDQLAAANKNHAAELQKLKDENTGLKVSLEGELIGGSFNRSKLISEKFAIPPDLVQARFGKHFKIEDGKVVAYDAAGNKVFSRSRPGDLADFDEALETIVGAYPHKDTILKGPVKEGSGATNGGGGGGGKFNFSKKAQDMTPEEKGAFISERGLPAWNQKTAADYAPTKT